MLDLLGLFPSFLAGRFGGVEASAAAAWRMAVREAPMPRETLLVSYGDIPTSWDETAVGPAVFAADKGTALKLAWKAKPARLVFLWHIGLLKLLPALKTSESRVVLFLHGIEVWRRQDWLTRRLLSRVDLFLSNSNFTWERFLTYHPDAAHKQHCTVALGLGYALSSPLPLDPDAPPAALIVGRMDSGEAYKGHRELISGWPAIQRQVPSAELWIVGGGSQRLELEELAGTLGVHGAVRFYGQVPDSEKDHLLRRARCLAMPSRGEGFGLVYLEAMRLGRPCLVSTLDAGREVVQPPEAGLAVDPAQQPELVAALVRLLTPGTEWDRWSQQAHKRYNTQFTEAHFVERLRTALFAPSHTASRTAVSAESLA